MKARGVFLCPTTVNLSLLVYASTKLAPSTKLETKANHVNGLQNSPSHKGRQGLFSIPWQSGGRQCDPEF